MSKEVTCILTSCGRFDLLRITLESFFVHNSYDIKEFYIYEDSNTVHTSQFPEYPFIKWILPAKNTGQIQALDTLWQQVTTPYAFTMEDDWEFLAPGFIEASMNILEACPNVLQVWLNNLEPGNTHPVQWVADYWGILKSEPNLWAGTRFNPALKRKADYDLIAPFSQHTQWQPEKPWKCEADISKVYHKLGFKGAILSQQYIRHIGGGRHVS